MAKHFHTLKHNIWLPYRFAVGPVMFRFYEGLMAEKILANRCPQCRKVLVPPRTFCPACNVDMDEWVEVGPEGTVVSWTLADYEFYGRPVDPPFIGALIQLDGADVNFLHLVGGLDLDDRTAVENRVKRGARVRAVWAGEKKGHLLDIKYFQPI